MNYKTSTKEDYRRRLYDHVERALAHRPVADRRVLLLDTTRALETIHLLRRGYRAENLTVVNGAVAPRNRGGFKAAFTRSLAAAGFANACRVHPGADLLAVAARGHFDVINYDSCGPVTGAAWSDYVRRLKARVVSSGVFALTILAGREDAAMVKVLLQTMPRGSQKTLHAAREAYVRLALDAGNSIIALGSPELRFQYRNSKSPMRVYAFQLADREAA